MAHLRQLGPSFAGIVDTLDTSTSSKSNVKMTDQKHMSRIPTWKTGTVANDSGTGVNANTGTPLSYSHTDFPNTGDQVSMSDFRSIFANVAVGQASHSTSSLKTQVTTLYTGYATSAGLAAASTNIITGTQIGSALSEGTTYTTSAIPINNNYGSTSQIGSNVSCEAILVVGVSFSFFFRLVFSGTGASSISSGLDVLARGNNNLLSFSSTGPDGTWNQQNTSPNGGFNTAFDFSSTTPTKSTQNSLTVFNYVISGTFNVSNLSGGQANFTAKCP
tara:strand:+ start:1143 stop:1967 length:825 start_codon:yes stop_codon:yes gene_type:complete